MKPLFIFSLPRSGSTLLQRMLMGHSEISSVAEPWLLLPLVYMYRVGGTLAEYSHITCQEALEDLVSNTSGGMATHYQAIREYSSFIYEKVAERDSTYFVDKTPRYYLIIDDIAQIYPNAKFIFLFRNPLSIYASIISTWNEGTFKNAWWNAVDLQKGPTLLAQGYKKMQDRSLSVRYEDLVREPRKQLERISTYLGLNFEDGMLSLFQAQDVAGRMGDATGVKSYKTVSTEGLDKWKSVFTNRFRKKILQRYLAGLPAETLATQGYDKEDLLRNVRELAVSGVVLRDVYYYCRSQFILATKANILFPRQQAWLRNNFLN